MNDRSKSKSGTSSDSSMAWRIMSVRSTDDSKSEESLITATSVPSASRVPT